MTNLVILPLLLQVIIPAALLSSMVLGRHTSRATWFLRVVATGAYLVSITVAGVWLAVPAIALAGFWALYVVLAWRSFQWSDRTLWPEGRRGHLVFGAVSILGICTVGMALYALSGRVAPGVAPIDLSFPLRSGIYYVANGGSNHLVSAHIMTLSSDRFKPWRGQSDGVDLVKLNAWGLRAGGVLPGNPRSYVIYGDSVFAPASGRVTAATGNLVDLNPPVTDRTHMAGNHILLDSDGTWILLGHLRMGTVAVHPGDSVVTGQYLGQVGNTGNSDEPHLHIHAQRPGTTAEPLGGDPVPVTFEGRYLVRNGLIRRIHVAVHD